MEKIYDYQHTSENYQGVNIERTKIKISLYTMPNRTCVHRN